MKPISLPEPGQHRNYDALDPLDSRYYDPEISQYLSERARIAYQAYVEAALAHTLAEFGVCSSKIAQQIDTASRRVTAEAVYDEEKVTRHDIKAVVNAIKQHLSDEAKPYVHFGATSQDVISTAGVLQIRAAVNKVIVPRLVKLIKTLIALTEKYAETTQIGRTHGQHAVPITFGFTMAEFVSRLGESLQAIQALSVGLKGQFSGAVGAYNALSLFVDDPLKFERQLLAKLDLTAVPYSTQLLPAEYVVRLLDELTITAGIMANLGHDMRHLQRSEIGEVREKFEKGQTGSSTMAHKRNPWNFENVISMNKQIVGQLVNAQLNLSSEHQRDLTDSASVRFYNVTLASVAAMATRLNNVMSKLEVDPDAMQRNLQLSGGAIAAEPFYLLLAKYGHLEAHEMSKALAHQALAKKRPLVEVIQADSEASAYWQKFSPAERKIITEPERYYTGLSAKKARMIAKAWRRRLS